MINNQEILIKEISLKIKYLLDEYQCKIGPQALLGALLCTSIVQVYESCSNANKADEFIDSCWKESKRVFQEEVKDEF